MGWIKYAFKTNFTVSLSFKTMWPLENLKWPMWPALFLTALLGSPKVLVPSGSSDDAEGDLWESASGKAAAWSPLTRSPDGSPRSPRSSGPACLLFRTIPEGLPARPAWPVGTEGEQRGRRAKLEKRVILGLLRKGKRGQEETGFGPLLALTKDRNRWYSASLWWDAFDPVL